METGTGLLARALHEAALRHGVRITVATSAAETVAAAADDMLVTISTSAATGTADIVRNPMPHEGGALNHHQVDVTVVDGALRTATAAWIEEWALAVGIVDRTGKALEISGAGPGDLPPWGLHIDAAAHIAFAAAGLDAGRMLSSAKWHHDDCGFSAAIEEEDLEVEAQRYLDTVRFPLIRITRDGHDIQYEETDGKAILQVRVRERFPETLLTAAAGRPLSSLVSGDGSAAPAPNTIRTAEIATDVLVVTADISRRRIEIPAKETTA